MRSSSATGAGCKEAWTSSAFPKACARWSGRRLARLGGATNEVLAAAAVIGRDFDTGVLRDAAGADVDAVLDSLDEAETAHLISSVDARRGRWTFVHALVRSTLYQEIPTARRLRLHRRIGEALETRDVETHLDALAHHYAEAAALGDTRKAVDYGCRAAEHALARLAYEEAAIDYERCACEPRSRQGRRPRGADRASRRGWTSVVDGG